MVGLSLVAWFLWLSAGGLPVAAGAGARETPAERVLAEITVTARRQETELQAAPVAVSVVSGTDVERSGVVKLDDFNGYAPALMVTKNDGAGRVVSVRGVGWETAQNLSTQPGVLVYVDGVYLANPLALGLDLLDLERIEVFRGPQGVEFGQSATGGAIHLVTRRPGFGGAGGELALRIGTHGLLEGVVAVNLPVDERAALRAGLRKHVRGGFAEIRGGALDGYELDDADTLTGHLSAEWLPAADLSVRLAARFQRSDQHGAAQKQVGDPDPDPRRLTQDYPSRFGLDNTLFSAFVDWDGPWGTRVRSVTGFQRLEKRQTVDGDRLTEELVAIDLTGLGPANFDLLLFWDNGSEAFSQELAVRRDGERLDWVAGLYYLAHDNDTFFLEAVGPAPVSQFEDRLRDPSPETLPPFVVPLEFVEDRTVSRRDSALYGQVVYRLAPHWALTFGGRLQNDRSTDRATQFWFVDSRQRLEDDAFTWKVGTDVALGDDHLLYLSAATGWKNGGANPGARRGALDVPVEFAPEEVTAFELGTRNRLAGGRAQLNAALFVYDYENFQFIQEDPVPFAAGTGNLPEVEIHGLEAELSWLLTDRLRLDGHLSALGGEIRSPFRTLDVVDFLNSGFGRFTPTAVEDRAGLRVDLRGNDPPKLPDLTARLLLTHTHDLAGGGSLISRLELIHRGEYQYRVFNHPVADAVPAYRTAGLSFVYRPARRPLELSLSATNLLDEAGVNSRFTNPFGLHTTSQEYIPPRQLVAALRYHL